MSPSGITQTDKTPAVVLGERFRLSPSSHDNDPVPFLEELKYGCDRKGRGEENVCSGLQKPLQFRIRSPERSHSSASVVQVNLNRSLNYLNLKLSV